MFKKILRYLPALIWMLVIFYLSSQPTTGVTGFSNLPLTVRTQRFLILKSFHLAEYSILYILLFWAQRRSFKPILSSYLYAIGDEIHQGFIAGRNSLFSDTLIDLLGIFIGFVILKLLVRIKTIHRFFFAVKSQKI